MSKISATYSEDTGLLSTLTVEVGKSELTFKPVGQDGAYVLRVDTIVTTDLEEGYEPARAFVLPEAIGEAIRLAEQVPSVERVEPLREVSDE